MRLVNRQWLNVRDKSLPKDIYARNIRRWRKFPLHPQPLFYNSVKILVFWPSVSLLPLALPLSGTEESLSFSLKQVASKLNTCNTLYILCPKIQK